MNKLLIAFTACMCLTGCIKDGTYHEYDPIPQLVGTWKQSVNKTYGLHKLIFSSNQIKLSRLDVNNSVTVLVNGNYRISGDSIFAKDITLGTYRGFYYKLNCDVLFFDDYKVGFNRVK
ncbi:MAG: hypothetical protein LBH58_08180 [Tannerellaceae bacterium]|jgi:hypothetical protein|nr:hypothetical protein [Tannerellaceae bacterium]